MIFLFASGSCSFGVFRHRKLLGSDLVSSYSAAPEAADLDLQTSCHQVHRRSIRLPPGRPNSRLSKIHWRTLRNLPARTSPDRSPVRHSKFLTAGQALTPRKIICHRTDACPVTRKSARCQLARPVCSFCQLNRPGSSSHRTVTCCFTGIARMASGRNDWQDSSRHPRGPTSMARRLGIPCHSRRPAQVRAGGPGRDVCHRTAGQEATARETP